mgnify:FL=1
MLLTGGMLLRPGISCDNLPRFDVWVDGVRPDTTGFGYVCGWLVEGMGVTDPLRARRGALVKVAYHTDVTWGRLTYTLEGNDGVVRRGWLWGRQPSFRLPEPPGEYRVVIGYSWRSWLTGA